MKRGFIVFALIMLAVSLVFAGGQGEAKGEVVALEFWDHMTDEMVLPIIQGFEGANPGIKINRTYYGDPAITDALFVAAGTGTGPDIWYDWAGYLLWPLADDGFALDLTEYRKQYQWDKSLAKAALDLCVYKGGTWGVPYNYGLMPLEGRKDLIDKYNNGIVPANLAEMRRYGDRLAKEGIALMTTAGVDGWHFMRVVQSLVESYVGAADHNKIIDMEASWEHPKVYAGFTEVQNWVKAGYFPTGFMGIKPGETKIPLYSGKAAVTIEGPWFYSTIKQDGMLDIEFVVFPFPGENTATPNRVIAFPNLLGITKSTKYPDEAVKFAHYVAVDAPNKYADVWRGLPAASNYNMPADQKMVKDMVDLAAKVGVGGVWDQVIPYEIVLTEFEVQDALAGFSITPQEGAQKIQKAVEAFKANR